MTTIRKIILHKDKLSKMPEDQRRFFVYAGHILNELNFFSKMMLIFQQTASELVKKLDSPGGLSDEEDAQMAGNGTQIQIMTKLFAGKLCEAICFLERWALTRQWFGEIKKNSDLEFQESFQLLSTYISNSKKSNTENILRFVRNSFGFHYDPDAVNLGADDLSTSSDFTYFLGNEVGNCLYHGSEEAVSRAMNQLGGFDSTEKTLEKMITECLDLAPQIKNVLGKTLYFLVENNFGNTLRDLGEVAILDIPSLNLRELRLPYFVEIPNKE